MQPLSTTQLLTLWEQGVTQSPAQWALAVLAAACPEMPVSSLERLSIGARDGQILTLREWTFGPDLACLAACPTCSEKLEIAFQAADIRTSPMTVPAEYALVLDSYDVHFRLPNSLDATLIAGTYAPADNQLLLLRRCLLGAQHAGVEIAADALPEPVTEAIIKQMAEADPQADIQLALTCPVCGHQWLALFDIVAFFWAEINAWTSRFLHEVHILASAYGWSEAEILALTPWRRYYYLEMIRNRS